MKMSLPALRLLHMVREMSSYDKANERTTRTVRRNLVKKEMYQVICVFQYLVALTQRHYTGRKSSASWRHLRTLAVTSAMFHVL